jgi:hypothetical protein
MEKRKYTRVVLKKDADHRQGYSPRGNGISGENDDIPGQVEPACQHVSFEEINKVSEATHYKAREIISGQLAEVREFKHFSAILNDRYVGQGF